MRTLNDLKKRPLDNSLGLTERIHNSEECPDSEFIKIVSSRRRFHVKQHYTRTEDGYVIALFNVKLVEAEFAKLSECQKKNRNRPVVIMHGLFSDAEIGLNNRHPDKSFSYHLINSGFDVWFPSNRGSKYSLTHDPIIGDKEFFDFSFEQLGLYDVPAVYQYILGQDPYKNIPNQKIIYIGHSQGTTQMFVSLADEKTKDYVRAHTERFFAFAPVVYMTKVRDGA